jgi:uncharacterized membrane protein YfcA
MSFALPVDLGWISLAVVIAAVTLGYLVFGATGFGASIVSVPTLAHVLPLTFVVPLITAVDLAAAVNATLRQWRHVDWREFLRLLFPALIGIALGSTILVRLPRDVALLALGIFTIAFALHALRGVRRWRAIRTQWAIPAGVIGGGFSALFGTGGPIYMAYLASRIEDKTSLRATSSLVIAAAVVGRAVAFGFTSLWLQPGLLPLALLLVPCMLAGYAIGSQLHAKLSGPTIRSWIAWLLLVNGTLLALRATGVVR